jgi:hypothetical protein
VVVYTYVVHDAPPFELVSKLLQLYWRSISFSSYLGVENPGGKRMAGEKDRYGRPNTEADGKHNEQSARDSPAVSHQPKRMAGEHDASTASGWEAGKMN